MKNKRPELNHEMRNSMNKNPNNWWGIFYFNRKDGRTLVPKSNPNLGWTLNFGNVNTYLAIIGFLLIAILFSYFIK
ncbi:MAG: hypothetical protein Q8O72_14870 [Bacteroidales bacterium]|jgi:uncharacterized membrane protein|nr:hypothetical protein [Bacteroidales bacterium]